MDINSLFLAIAGLSASFVAILGGLIVSRLITINGERSLYVHQLDEITWQLNYYRGMRNMIEKNRTEEDAIRYIHDHLSEVVEGVPLDDVYEKDELQFIDFDDLEPFWKYAQYIKKIFDTCLVDNEYRLNNDLIPVKVAEEYSDNLFAYEFCEMYARWRFTDYDFEDDSFYETNKSYERDGRETVEYTNQIVMLETRENQLKKGLKELKKPVGMRSGLVLFALFSLFNIILPLVLSLFSFSVQNSIVAAITLICFLAIGLTATFIYLVWMLKWKKIEDYR